MIAYSFSGNYTDLYQLSMGAVYFRDNKHLRPACFDYFFRKIPGGGGYVLFAGLEELLPILETLRFTPEDLEFLRAQSFDKEYINFLSDFRFTGTIHAAQEGEVVFPGCPLLRVEGKLFEVQLVETILLNILNFQSLIATKASRMRYVAPGKELSDFGLRRAQGPAALMAARAAIVGGFDSTSNVQAAARYGIKAAGTMAHSFIESYDCELDAFRAYAQARPGHCVFLVDTYDTLNSGIPNAITVAKELEQQGGKAQGIRLDSGDLAWLSRMARRMLDEAGLSHMKIVVSNQLDEELIKSLLEQGAPIDVMGVGTRLITGYPDAALDGVYKLSEFDGEPKLKLSETIAKVTLPGNKTVMRLLQQDGSFAGGDLIQLTGGNTGTHMLHPFEPGQRLELAPFRWEPLLHTVMQNGRRTQAKRSLTAIATYARERLQKLPAEYKRFQFPHTYKVGITQELLELRDELIEKHKFNRFP